MQFAAKSRIVSALGSCGICWVVFGCAPSAAPVAPANQQVVEAVPKSVREEQSGKILRLMRDRLELMHDVARWKWNEDKPISDPARERKLLDELGNRAERLGLSTAFAQTFFQAQFDAGKLIQEADFATWKAESQGKFEDVPDLGQVIRPRIDQLSGELLSQLSELQDTLNEPDFQQELRANAVDQLSSEGISDSVRNTAMAPLLN